VQDNTYIPLEELAEKFDYPLTELEQLFFDGKFGPGTVNIVTNCHRCGVAIRHIQRKGRFCFNCADRVEDAAQLKNPLVNNRPERTERAEPTRSNMPVSAVTPDPPTEAPQTAQYGFKRV
jgi:hypothetical protein